MSVDCPRCEDAAAYVAEELSPDERKGYDAHLAACATCREAVATTRRIVGLLQSAPAPEPVRDLAPGILARVRAERPPLRFWPRAAAVAAVLALLAGSAQFWRRQPAPGVDRALTWFCQTQEPDGSWNAEKWGGNARFEVALTALPLLALLHSAEPGPERVAAIDRASGWLRKQQTPEGSFGPEFQGASYNQSIATLALLQIHQRFPVLELKEPLDAAVATILARQTRDGGWGYLRSPLADRSITMWHLKALAAASTLGWENARPALERGREWLAAHPDRASDPVEPPDSPSALLATGGSDSKMDFHRAWMLATSLEKKRDGTSRRQLADIRKTLLARQEPEGSARGSWAPDDRWGQAGGRLYSTALASLSLRDR